MEELEVAVGIAPGDMDPGAIEHFEDLADRGLHERSRHGIPGQLSVTPTGEGAEWIQCAVVEHLRPEYAAHVPDDLGGDAPGHNPLGQGLQGTRRCSEDTPEGDR